MSVKQPPWAYGIEHQWNGKTNRVVKISRAEADEYAVKWHGTIHFLYSEEQLTCLDQTSQHSSMTSEDACSRLDETATLKPIPSWPEQQPPSDPQPVSIYMQRLLL
jgi:hypothetical protein